MKDWNVVVTLRGRRFGKALRLLQPYGQVARSDFFNVLLMRVKDPRALLEALHARAAEDPAILDCLARVIPVTRTFAFQSPAEFEERAKEAAQEFVPTLSGRSFHVRVHRRGFKGRLSSLDQEHLLDDVLLERLASMGTPGRLSFEDPDAVVDVETVGTQAGMSLWTRQELHGTPLLHSD
jgi:tRNA(Ser,Leu) C12 N-acetylase TAN1